MAGPRLAEDEEAKQTTPPSSGTQTSGSPQPCVGCSIRAKTGPPRPTAESAIPPQSMPRKASGSRLSSTECRVSVTVAAISGRLTQKIARQEVKPIRAPPPAGPITVAIPVQAVQVPTALPRASPSKVAATIASEPGTSSAPAIPCSARAATRNSSVGATAQRAEVTPKPIRPMTNIRRRPNWSPSLPPTRSSETSASM